MEQIDPKKTYYSNPFLEDIDPIGETARKQRKNLVGISLVGIIVVKIGILPSKITTFGVQFTETDQKTILLIFLLTISYFIIGFVIYIMPYLVNFRNQYIERIIFLMQYKESEERNELKDKIAISIKKTKCYYWVKMIYEVIFPIIIGQVALIMIFQELFSSKDYIISI